MPSKKTIIGISLGLIALFVAYAVFAWSFADSDDNKAGQFGDAFGALNTLISALAFFGVTYAILQQQQALKLQKEQTEMQSEELRLQREELQQQREEIRQARIAHQESAVALTQQLETANARSRIESLNLLIDSGVRRSKRMDSIRHSQELRKLSIKIDELEESLGYELDLELDRLKKIKR